MPLPKKLIKLSVSLIACFFIGIAIDQACGPELDPYDYYPSFFHNTIQPNEDYRSFYFNGFKFLNDSRGPVTEADINSVEWAEQFKVPVKDVKKLMYGLNEKADSVLLQRYLKPNKKTPDSLSKNLFLRALVSGKHNNALRYYRFVKALEPLTGAYTDYRWIRSPLDSGLLIKKAKEALAQGIKEKDSFIKLRYFYQAQKLMHHYGEIKIADDIYRKYIAYVKSKSHVLGWALSLKAGEELRLGNRAKAAFLFSKVFANYPERRIQAYHDFNNIGESSENIFSFTKTNDEKAFIYAIAGFHEGNIGIAALESVYKCQPASPLVRVLLLREINKVEENYLAAKLYKTAHHNPYFTDYIYTFTGNDSIAKKQEAYLTTLKAFCARLANDGKYPEPAVGNLSLAYISWLQGETESGLKELSALQDKHLSAGMNDQKQLINLLLLAQKIKNLDTITTKELVPSLQWLSAKVKWEAKNVKVIYVDDDYYTGDYDFKYYSASARDFYAKVLAPAYLKQKDTAMAGLVILKSELTVPDTNIKKRLGFSMPDFLQRKVHSYDFVRIINWCTASSKSPYLKLLTADIHRNITYNLYELTGTAYLREHAYAKALPMFKRIPPGMFKNTPLVYPRVDPFIGHMHDANAGGKTPKEYIKLQFAKQMLKLQRLIKTDPQNAALYNYKIANGFYSTSRAGCAWDVIAYTNADYDTDRKRDEYYDADYLNATTAERYYIKARAMSKNKEFKARCTFMAAKCQQHQILFPPADYNHYKDYEAAIAKHLFKIKHLPYFTELKKNYPKTAFYKTAINECSYFRDFLGGAKK